MLLLCVFLRYLIKEEYKIKKLLIILLAGVFIAGCSNDDNSNETDKDDEVAEDNGFEDENTDNDSAEEKKDVYQIGETAQITSSSYDFPYEVTVNDFELTTDDVDGETLEFHAPNTGEDDRFAVINVTLKNISDEPLTPNDKISPQLIGDDITSESPIPELYKKGEEELAPGEEMTDDIVYVSNSFIHEKALYLTYEIADTKKEVKFELPVPEK